MPGVLYVANKTNHWRHSDTIPHRKYLHQRPQLSIVKRLNNCTTRDMCLEKKHTVSIPLYGLANMDSHIVGDVFILHNQRLYNPSKKNDPGQPPRASFLSRKRLRKPKKNLKTHLLPIRNGNGEWPPLETKLIFQGPMFSKISHFHDGRKS